MQNVIRLAITIAVMLVALPSGALAHQVSTPSSEITQTTVVGPGMELLPAGEQGAISVIAQAGPTDATDTIGFVIRNNTATTISNLEVRAEIRRGDKLVGVADDDRVYVENLKPGEVTFGMMRDSKVYESGLDVTFVFTYDEFENTSPYLIEFSPTGTEWTGDRILGELTNTSDRLVDDAVVVWACLADDGTLVAMDMDFIEMRLKPGESATFQTGAGEDPMTECGNYLVEAAGFPD